MAAASNESGPSNPIPALAPLMLGAVVMGVLDGIVLMAMGLTVVIVMFVIVVVVAMSMRVSVLDTIEVRVEMQMGLVRFRGFLGIVLDLHHRPFVTDLNGISSYRTPPVVEISFYFPS